MVKSLLKERDYMGLDIEQAGKKQLEDIRSQLQQADVLSYPLLIQQLSEVKLERLLTEDELETFRAAAWQHVCWIIQSGHIKGLIGALDFLDLIKADYDQKLDAILARVIQEFSKVGSWDAVCTYYVNRRNNSLEFGVIDIAAAREALQMGKYPQAELLTDTQITEIMGLGIFMGRLTTEYNLFDVTNLDQLKLEVQLALRNPNINNQG